MEALLSGAERATLDAVVAAGKQTPPPARGPQLQAPSNLPAPAAVRWLEMVEEPHKDAIVLTRDPDDERTFCRAARIRSTPDFGTWPKTMVEVEWLTLHEDGAPPVTGRVHAGSLQKLEQGDELLDLTQFGLPRPLPKEDRAAASANQRETADAAMEAMGPRPGTGERAC